MEEFKRKSIKNWAADDRPREKLLSKGIETLSDAELLAVLIGSGNRNESAVELSKRILSDNKNNLNELAKLSIADLQKYKGIGEAKAISIVAASELGKRRNIANVIERKQIKSSKDIFEIFGQKLGDLPYEEFWLMIMNRANKIIEIRKISAGGVSGTVTDIKIILKAAIEKTASGIIVCHNHPSGNIKPSNSDISLTKKLKAACELIDIPLLDHIIVAYSNYYSFADESMI
ncbi:MAG: JAB domain-containing protein [Chlorobi bacterium]|nr:JAB domain-containing protein [Chlorobiota bacterium]